MSGCPSIMERRWWVFGWLSLVEGCSLFPELPQLGDNNNNNNKYSIDNKDVSTNLCIIQIIRHKRTRLN